MEGYEFRAFIPRDQMDSWSQSNHTPWETEPKLLDRLVAQSKLPRGLVGVKVYKRLIPPSIDVTDEFIRLQVKS